MIKEKYPGAVSSQPTKKSNGPTNSKEGKKSGKGKGEKYWQASDESHIGATHFGAV